MSVIITSTLVLPSAICVGYYYLHVGITISHRCRLLLPPALVLPSAIGVARECTALHVPPETTQMLLERYCQKGNKISISRIYSRAVQFKEPSEPPLKCPFKAALTASASSIAFSAKKFTIELIRKQLCYCDPKVHCASIQRYRVKMSYVVCSTLGALIHRNWNLLRKMSFRVALG